MADGKEGNILEVTKREQFKTVNELFERSEPNSLYYTLLIVSAFVIASGLLLNNGFIIIGGMLITPVLTPVLLIALGVAVGEPSALKDSSILLAKSFLLIVGASLLITFIFGPPNDIQVFENTMRTALLYFIVAVGSGAAATFTWARREVGEILQGVAIAVSLVPPLALIGIWLSALEFEIARFFFLVFIFNFMGVVVGSLVVFSLLKFHKAENKVHEEAKNNDTKS
jgi:uncharacterized hydrophobic protein (TIGR00271 family)